MVKAWLRSLYFQLKTAWQNLETLHAWSIICIEIWPNKHRSEKIQASLKNIAISRSEYHHFCSMMGTRFSSEKNYFYFAKPLVVCSPNQRPSQSNYKLWVEVFQDNDTDLALMLIFTHQIQNKGFMSRLWSVYSMNYAQNSILLGLRGAWRVCAKNLTNLNKPNFSQLILINRSLKFILDLVWKLCKKAGECYGFWKMAIFGSDFYLKFDLTLAPGPSLSNRLRTKLHLWNKS